MTKVAIYSRVSTDDQAEAQTIETQLSACREYCLRAGHEVVEVFKDEGVSGATALADRPKGKALLAALEARAIDRVVIYCLDRLSRDNETGVPAYNALHRLSGGHVEFVVQSFDDTIEGKLQFHIFLAIAEYERGVIRRRTSAGRRRRVEQGGWLSHYTPYGYDYFPGNGGGLTVNPVEAEAVRLMFKLYRSGLPLRAIAARLNADGVPMKRGGKTWTPEQVRRLLSNPIYKGEGRAGKTLMGKPVDSVPLPAEAIVTVREWNAVRARVKHNNRFGSRPKDAVSRYLLGGLAYCQTCGTLLTATTHRESHLKIKPGQERKQWSYYGCRKEGSDANGGHMVNRYLAAERVEKPVIEAIVAAFSDPALVLEAVNAYAESIEGGVEDAVLTDVRRNISERTAARERVLDLYTNGDIDAAAKDKRLARIDGELRRLNGTLGEMEAAATVREARAEIEAQAFAIAASIRQIFESEPFERQREWMRTLVDKVWIDAKGNVHIDAVVPGLLPVGVSDYKHQSEDSVKMGRL